jgi:hypothetical protein
MLYTPPNCPVNAYDKEWIEKTLVWFEEKLGSNFIKNREYFIPAAQTFRYSNFNSHEAIQYFVNFICSYIELDASLVTFSIIWNELPGDEGGLPDDFDVHAADDDPDDPMPLPVLNDEGKYIVAITEDMLDDFDGIFLSLSFQIPYIWLFHKKVFTFYNKYMVNYAAVAADLGIPAANIFVRTWQWSGLQHSAWRVSSLGALSHRMYGYLFALLVKYRNKPAEPWLQYLTADVSGFYKEAVSYLEAQHAVLQLPAHAANEEVFIDQYFYEGGGLSLIAHIVNNSMEGHAVSFYENGQLWSEIMYKNDRPYTELSNYNPFDEPVEKG